MSPTGLVAHVLDLLENWGGVTSRSMFGGHGLYRRGIIFGMVVEDTLYLKADDVNRPAFEARGLKPFTYAGKGKTISMSYFEVPSECLDDGAVLRTWSEQALAASGRKQSPKKKPVAKKKAARRR